jgi:hypothetical protein
MGLQIIHAYPGSVYSSLSDLERRRVHTPGDKGRTTHSIWGKRVRTCQLYVFSEPQILQLCRFTTPHRCKVDASLKMAVQEPAVAIVAQHLHSRFLPTRPFILSQCLQPLLARRVGFPGLR